MGVEKFNRKVLTPGIKGTSGSTFAGDVQNSVQTITLSGASGIGTTAITNDGVTFITSTGTGAGWTLNLAAPSAAGVRKSISINPASTVPVQVRTASSSQAFFGSTANAFTATTAGTTGAVIGKVKTVNLVSVSASQWAVTGIYPVSSTGTTFVTVQGATA